MKPYGSDLRFPDAQRTAALDFVLNSTQNDFDEQSGLYDGLNLNYTQLTPGPFQSRFMSAELGQVTIYLEYCNQAIEREVSVPPGQFAVFLGLRKIASFFQIGVTNLGDGLFVVPPKGASIFISPKDGVGLTLLVECDALFENSGMIPEVRDWLKSIGQQGEMITSERLVRSIRTDLLAALDCIEHAITQQKRFILNEAALFSIASALTLEWLNPETPPKRVNMRGFERFRSVRNVMINASNDNHTEYDRGSISIGSRRAVEQAFSDHVGMGPLSYERIMRLHNARRKLLDPVRLNDSIGDIAAEEGFWDWGRFTNHYRKHFGQMPSETRASVADAIHGSRHFPAHKRS